jgi:hypothetical protein
LDAAIKYLGDRECDAILLRFFEHKTLKEVSSALGVNEGVAQKSVEQALKKLCNFFSNQGITLSPLTLADVLSSHSIQAAPSSLAESIVTAGRAKGATIREPTRALMRSTLRTMAWLKIKTKVGQLFQRFHDRRGKGDHHTNPENQGK